MKKCIFFLCLIMCGGVFAQKMQSRVPPAMLPYIRTIADNIRLWEFESARPLEESMPELFARGGWRLEFTRPLMNASSTMVYNTGNTPKNSAELIFIADRKNADWSRVRKLLRWKAGPQELYNTVCDIGTAGKWRIYARADVQTLDLLKNLFRARGGDAMEEILAESLLHEDLNNTTRIRVPHFLGKYGNRAIQPLNRALGKAIAEEKPVEPFFRSFQYINTPESAMEFRKALNSGYPGLADKVRRVLADPPYMKDGIQLYLDNLSKHAYTESCIKALLELKEEKQLIPVLERLVRRPAGYLELVTAVYTLKKIRTGKNSIPENDIAEEILMLTARSGDVPGSSKMVSIKSAESSYNNRIAEEEKRRIQPLIEQMLRSEDMDCAVLATLSLVLFSPSEQEFSKEYIRRINRYGWMILTRLPRKNVLNILYRIRNNCINDKERNVISGIAVRLR